MKIRELYLKNFGKFSEKRIVFSDGINIVYGRNEAGKTTLCTSVGALLFGLERQRGIASRTDVYRKYQPWEYPAFYSGKMKFETGGKIFCIDRNFYQNEKSVRLVCETDGEELSAEHGDLEMLLGGISKELYYNTAAVSQMTMKPRETVYDHLENYIAALQENGRGSLDVVRTLEILEKKRKELEQKKRKAEAEIRRQIDALGAKIEITEQELFKNREQLEKLRETCIYEREKEETKSKGFLAAVIRFLKRLFCRRSFAEKAKEAAEKRLKLEEKEKVFCELCGEKESICEELLMEQERMYEKLHEQSEEEEIQAVLLASERIRELSVLRKEEVMQQLLEKASGVLEMLTDGDYSRIFLKDGYEPEIWDGSRRISLFQLSTGCAEQVYLALRIAMQDLLLSEEEMPLIFDDAFVYFDEERLERILLYLSKLERQVILLTCQKREVEILEYLGMSYQKIIL